jgi:hypothetical protein
VAINRIAELRIEGYGTVFLVPIPFYYRRTRMSRDRAGMSNDTRAFHVWDMGIERKVQVLHLEQAVLCPKRMLMAGLSMEILRLGHGFDVQFVAGGRSG